MIKKPVAYLVMLIIFVTCSQPVDKERIRSEVFQAEKDFEKMAADSGIANAFHFFAADNAVILRHTDSIISGRSAIRNYYDQPSIHRASVTWTPDYVEVSEDGTMAYTYGRYVWRFWSEAGDTITRKGIFHTVWQRKADGTWRYVWD